jgi:uncharacterized integral membrane protein
MARKIVFWLVLIPLAILLVMFAVANREVVTVSLDPFNSAQPAWSLRMPLFVLVLGMLTLGVLVGGFAAWVRQGRYRRSARGLRSEMAGLRHEVEALNARLETENRTPPAHPDAMRIPLQPPLP